MASEIEIFWDPPAPDFDFVWVDVDKLNTLWADSNAYIGPFGEPDDQKGKYGRVGEWLSQTPCLSMSDIRLEEDGNIAFGDGRHRFAWLRDHGAKAVPVIANGTSVAVLEELLGSTIRATLVIFPDSV